VAEKSNTPTSKSVPITIRPSPSAVVLASGPEDPARNPKMPTHAAV
jgi:hypothetical protein